jgi:hypothetical protein
VKLAPIILFVYNRPWHLKQTLLALAKNYTIEDSELFIYADGPRPEGNADQIQNIKEVRKIINEIDWCKHVRIIEREENYGLARNIITGVTEVLSTYESAIILEDDLITAPDFLKFMNDSLAIYSERQEVGMIHGHIYRIPDLPDLFFMYKAGCLGWATWRRVWNEISFDGPKLLREIEERRLERKFDIEYSYPYTNMLRDQIAGKNNSWAIRFYASLLLLEKLTFYPGNSLVQHIGWDQGTNSSGKEISPMDGVISEKYVPSKKISVENSSVAIRKLRNFYRKQFPYLQSHTWFRKNLFKVKFKLNQYFHSTSV